MRPAVSVWFVGALVACGGANMMPREEVLDPVPTAVGPPPPLDDDPATKVETLYTDLVARQKALSLPSPPPLPNTECEPVCELAAPPDKPTRTPECTVGAACAEACVQADAACDDAAKICAIAKDQRTDAAIAGRCRDASAICAAAHAPCCGCK